MADPYVIGLTVAGWLASTWLAYRWGLHSKKLDRIHAEKALIVPAIKKAIKDCGSDDPLCAWSTHKDGLQDGALRFSTILSGRKKAAFDRAWEVCESTTNQELGTNELAPAQRLIKSRLEAFLETVDAA